MSADSAPVTAGRRHRRHVKPGLITICPRQRKAGTGLLDEKQGTKYGMERGTSGRKPTYI